MMYYITDEMRQKKILCSSHFAIYHPHSRLFMNIYLKKAAAAALGILITYINFFIKHNIFKVINVDNIYIIIYA